MRLSELRTGQSGTIVRVGGHGAFRKRIMEMGFVRGMRVEVIRNAPLRDPVEYRVMGYNVSLRREEAARIDVVSDEEMREASAEPQSAFSGDEPGGPDPDGGRISREELIARFVRRKRMHRMRGFLTAGMLGNKSRPRHGTLESGAHRGRRRRYSVRAEETRPEGAGGERKTVRVALVGNPNCGKTSLFNLACGTHEHVGNYSGVTVDAREGRLDFRGYRIRIADLPGTYSLTAYSPEELYVRRYIAEQKPDVIINVADASNPERNLYLTAQLLDMEQRVVVALNMYDELERSGDRLDHRLLGTLLGVRTVPTVCRENIGMERLLEAVVAAYEGREAVRPRKVNYGRDIEEAISAVDEALEMTESLPEDYPARYLAIKLLEKDPETENYVSRFPGGSAALEARDKAARRMADTLGTDSETAVTDARYGFIAGALRETYRPAQRGRRTRAEKIDAVLTHRVWGFPLFLLFLWIMFQSTYTLGDWPMRGIEWCVERLGEWVGGIMAPGPLRDLLTDGIIGGVGGVLVFLPNILILYLFISVMEDTGYMARAAFIMDKLMHKMGLHGKSFIPLVMGFGCNVPAIMATRTIESRKSRLVTILVNPLISCSARLPVYILLIGIFFPRRGGLVLLSLYVVGILLAVLAARIFSKALIRGGDLPFVMELPPYRMPTARAVARHTWEKGVQYLRKIGGIIMIASVIIWFLGYYPRGDEGATAAARQENSYLGRIGKAVAPAMEPLGFDWRMDIGLIAGAGAKELVASTLLVLYAPDEPAAASGQAGPGVTDGRDDASRADGGKADRGINRGDDADGTNVGSVPDGGGDINGAAEGAGRLETMAAAMGISRLTAYCYLLFILIYFPCLASLAAIRQESGSWKWALFTALYTTALAWIVSFTVAKIGGLFL